MSGRASAVRSTVRGSVRPEDVGADIARTALKGRAGYQDSLGLPCQTRGFPVVACLDMEDAVSGYRALRLRALGL